MDVFAMKKAVVTRLLGSPWAGEPAGKIEAVGEVCMEVERTEVVVAELSARLLTRLDTRHK